MATKLYAESKVELSPMIARHYDRIMNSISFGKYNRFIQKAVGDMDIRPGDHILDLGCGTGKNAGLMARHLGKEGKITGIDLSPVMQKQFRSRHESDNRIDFISQRIDLPFDLGVKYDKVLISFVIHGFPHKIREEILRNAYTHLRKGGQLIILDFAEFSLKEMPVHHRYIFKRVECTYAFDYIERDWKTILESFGFSFRRDYHYFRNYARLLVADKTRKK